jgi:hypothetical protein
MAMKKIMGLFLICIVLCAGCAKKKGWVVGGIITANDKFCVEISSAQKDIDEKYYGVVVDVQKALIQSLRDKGYEVVSNKSDADIVLSLYMLETQSQPDRESVFKSCRNTSSSLGPLGLLMDAGQIVVSSIKKGLSHIPRKIYIMNLKVYFKEDRRYVYRGMVQKEYIKNQSKFVKSFVKDVDKIVGL